MAGDPHHGEIASKIIERIEEGEETVTSTLVISQVCSYLKWRKRSDVIPKFLGFPPLPSKPHQAGNNVSRLPSSPRTLYQVWRRLEVMGRPYNSDADEAP